MIIAIKSSKSHLSLLWSKGTKKKKSTCQVESGQGRTCWQISQPAGAWNDKKRCPWGLKLGDQDSVDLGGRSGEFGGWEQMSCVYLSKFFSVTLWHSFPWYCSIRRLWEMQLLLICYLPTALPYLSLVFFFYLSCNHPNSPLRWLFLTSYQQDLYKDQR